MTVNPAEWAKKKTLALSTVTPALETITRTYNPTLDTHLQLANPTADHGTDAEGYIWGKSTNATRMIQRFALTSVPSGYTLISASLVLTTFDDFWGAFARIYNYYKIKNTPGTAWVSAADWNHYDGEGIKTDWTGGHDGGLADIDGALAASAVTKPAIRPATMTWNDANFLAIVQDAITNCSNVLNLMLKDSAETSGDNDYASFGSVDNTTPASRPLLTLTWTRTPSVPSNYKLPIIIHRGSPTVERVDRTINGKAYRYRLPFTITALSATGAGYSGVEVAIDTAKLVAGGINKFFGGAAISYASTVEFVQKDGADDTTNLCKYCMETNLGVVENWNTDHTIYILRIPLAMSAGTEYQFYVYFDSNRTEQSSNYLFGAPDTAAGVWNFFRDFAITAADHDAFIAAYPEWELVCTGGAAHPTITVGAASSIVNVTGSTAGQFSGIRVLTASFHGHDFKIRIRYVTHVPDSQARTGMCSTTANSYTTSAIHSTGIVANEFAVYRADATSDLKNIALPATGAFTVEMRKVGTKFHYVFIRDRSNGYPDYWTLTPIVADQFNDLVADDGIDYVPFIACYESGPHQHIDYVAVGDFVENEPEVFVPNVIYDEDGVVFAENAALNWPYDIALTGTDGTTEIYWYPDRLAERSKHPGDSIDVILRTTTLASGICAYFGNSDFDAGSPNPYNDPTEVYGDADAFWDDYDAWANYTAIGAGTWAAADVAEPVFRRGDAGNVPLGGGGGRTFTRQPSVVKWDTNKYIMVACGSYWQEAGSYWPSRLNIQIAFGTSINGEFGPGKIAFIDPVYSGYAFGIWPQCARVYGTGANKKLYVLYVRQNGKGLGIASCPDPYADVPVWTINTNFLLDDTWLQSTGNWAVGDFVLHYGATFIHDGTKWRIIYKVSNAANNIRLGYAITTDLPENWINATSFTDYGLTINPAPDYVEDFNIIYDSLLYWYLFAIRLSGGGFRISYWRTDHDDFSAWAGPTDPTINTGPFAAGVTYSPRLLLDIATYYMHHAGIPLVEAESFLGKWIMNYAGCSSSATLNGVFAAENTIKKAYLSNTTGLHFAYKDNYAAPSDFELMTELMLKPAGGQTAVGILFNYDETAQTGYAAFLAYHSGVPTLECYKIVANALVAFSPAQSYTIPIFPLPRFYPGLAWRLFVQRFGGKIKVGYSPWGNATVWGLDFTDGNYSGTRIGLIANAGASYWDKLRLRAIVKNAAGTEPYVNQAAGALQDILAACNF
jgi:hypothetical protein